jgi:hypothetical protein
MSPSDFWMCDLWEVLAAIEGYQEQEERKAQQQWEMFRFSAFYSMLPHSKKGSLKQFKDVAVFPWDAKPQPISAIDRKALFDKIKKIDGSMKDIKKV